MFSWLLAAYITGQSGDTISTIVALQKPNLFREGNPVLGNSINRIVLTKVAINTTTIITASKFRKKHPKVSFVLLGTGAALGTYATIHNIKEIKKYQ